MNTKRNRVHIRTLATIEAIKACLDLIHWLSRLEAMPRIDAEDIGDCEWLIKHVRTQALNALRWQSSKVPRCDDSDDDSRGDA